MNQLDKQAQRFERQGKKLQRQIEESLLKGDIPKARMLTQKLRVLAAKEEAIGEALMRLANELGHKGHIERG